MANGSGTLTSANVINVAVTCGPLSPLTVTNSTPATGAREVARDNALTVSFYDLAQTLDDFGRSDVARVNNELRSLQRS